MQRRWSRYLRFGLLALMAAFLLVVGVVFAIPRPDSLSNPAHLASLVQVGAPLVAGVLFVLAGHDIVLTERDGWHRLVGPGDVLLGFSMALSALVTGYPADTTIVYVLVAILGGLTLVVIDVGVARRSRHFGIDPVEAI